MLYMGKVQPVSIFVQGLIFWLVFFGTEITLLNQRKKEEKIMWMLVQFRRKNNELSLMLSETSETDIAFNFSKMILHLSLWK